MFTSFGPQTILVFMSDTAKTVWPSMTIDQKAWELAKTAVGESDLHALIAKANEYKKSLKEATNA